MPSESGPRLSDRLHKVLALANQEAQRLEHAASDSEHLLLGLVKEGSCSALSAQEARGVDLPRVRKEVERRHARGSRVVPGRFLRTAAAEAVVSRAAQLATDMGHESVQTEHLLLALLEEDQGVHAEALRAIVPSLERLRTRVLSRLWRLSKPLEPADNTRTRRGRKPGNLQAGPRPNLEMKLVGSLLLDAKALDEVRTVLGTHGAIRHAGCRAVYDLVCAAHDRGERMDLLSLRGELSGTGQLAAIGDSDFVLRLIQSVPDARRTVEYAKLLTIQGDHQRGGGQPMSERIWQPEEITVDGRNLFVVPDGEINKGAYREAKIKVVHLLKEVSGPPTETRGLGEKLTGVIQNNGTVKYKMWKVTARRSFMLHHDLPKWADCRPNLFGDAFRASAVVNLNDTIPKAQKKRPESEDSKVLRLARERWASRRRKLQMLEPSVVICGGSYRLLRKLLAEKGEEIDASSGDFFVWHGVPFIHAYHPKFRGQHAKEYEDLRKRCLRAKHLIYR